jgi:hypothetical protein
MKNENLSYKIKTLLDASSDPEWDPDRFWNLFEARKRKRQRWVAFSYSMAATVIFVVASVVLTGDGINRYTGIDSRVSSIPQSKEISHLPENESEKSLVNEAGRNAGHIGLETSITSKISRPGHSRIKSAKHERIYFGKPGSTAMNVSYANDPYNEQSASILAEENDQMPSLLRMFEQAQKEREQRNLSVQLEDRANYNSFWLTVNQHLLANKLSSDQLHYERY